MLTVSDDLNYFHCDTVFFLCAAEISKHKGPPVFSEKERYKMVRAIKWVDEVNSGDYDDIESLV